MPMDTPSASTSRYSSLAYYRQGIRATAGPPGALEARSVPANLPYFFSSLGGFSSSGSPSWGRISSPAAPSCGNQSTITDPDSTYVVLSAATSPSTRMVYYSILILNDDARTCAGVDVLDHRRRLLVTNAGYLKTIVSAKQ